MQLWKIDQVLSGDICLVGEMDFRDWKSCIWSKAIISAILNVGPRMKSRKRFHISDMFSKNKKLIPKKHFLLRGRVSQ